MATKRTPTRTESRILGKDLYQGHMSSCVLDFGSFAYVNWALWKIKKRSQACMLWGTLAPLVPMWCLTTMVEAVWSSSWQNQAGWSGEMRDLWICHNKVYPWALDTDFSFLVQELCCVSWNCASASE